MQKNIIIRQKQDGEFIDLYPKTLMSLVSNTDGTKDLEFILNELELNLSSCNTNLNKIIGDNNILNEKVNIVDIEKGELELLETVDKTNLVSSINEINNIVKNHDNKINNNLLSTITYLNNIFNDLNKKIIGIEMELKDKEIIDFKSNTGQGFFDIFNTEENIDKNNTSASVDTIKKCVIFDGDKDLVFTNEIFEPCKKIDMDLYSEIKRFKVKDDVNNSNIINIENTNIENPSIGNNIFINNSIYKIKDIDGGTNYIDNSNKTPYSKNVNLYETIATSNVSVYDHIYSSRHGGFFTDKNGDMYLIYRTDINNSQEIYCKKSYNSGKTWIDMKFPKYSTMKMSSFSAFLDKENNIHIAFVSKQSYETYYRIRYCKYDGEVWSTPVIIKNDGNYNQWNPKLVVDSKNIVHVIWEAQDSINTSDKIKYSKFDGLEWSDWINIDGSSIYSQGSSSLIIDNSDNLYVIWSSLSNQYNKSQILYSKFDGTSWSQSSFVFPTPEYSQSSPSICIDKNNNLHLLITSPDEINSVDQIKYSKFDGTSWSQWINVSPTSGYLQFSPMITIDNKNNLHVVWYGKDEINTNSYKIKYSKFDGISWSQWINISEDQDSKQEYPVLCITDRLFNKPIIAWSGRNKESYLKITGEVIETRNIFNDVDIDCVDLSLSTNNQNKCVKDSMGNIYVVYDKYIDSIRYVFCKRYSPKNKIWEDLNFPYIIGDGASIDVDSKDNIHVVWSGKDPSTSNYQIKYSKFDGTSWSNWINISPISGYHQNQCSMGIDKNDNLHVVWYGRDPSTSYYQIKYSKFDGVSWSNWINMSTVIGYDQYNPSIAIDNNNNLHVVWYGKDSTNTSYDQIKYSKFNGVSWSNWINISPISGYRESNPSIAIDSNNNLHVVWYGYDVDNKYKYQIKYSKFNGTSWSQWINISPISGYNQYNPSIDIDSNDNLHVVWYGMDIDNPSYQQIKYSKFNGTSWSDWINISNVSGYNQYYPSFCKSITRFLEPIILWFDDFSKSIQIKGKWVISEPNCNIIIDRGVSIYKGDIIIPIPLEPYINETPLNLINIDDKKYSYSLSGLVDNNVKIKIKGKDTELDKILYSIS